MVPGDMTGKSMPGRPKEPLSLSDEERAELERIVRARTAAQQQVLRARVVLLGDEGLSNGEVAEELGICCHTVGRWRRRFVRYRMVGHR